MNNNRKLVLGLVAALVAIFFCCALVVLAQVMYIRAIDPLGALNRAEATNGAPYVDAPPAATQAAPAATLAPAAPLAPVAGTCSKDALTASHDDNLVSGRYEMSYFGGTSEACYMFGEFNFGHARQTWLVIVPPGHTLNLAGFIGETMWYRESEGAVAWSIEDSTANLTRSDGRNEKTPIIVWVNDPATLKLLPAEAQYEVIPPALP